MKTAIVLDSISCPTEEQKEKYQFEIVPVNVRFQGKTYRDFIDFTAEQGYQFLDKNPEDWATSAPSPGDFLLAFKNAKAKGAKQIICLNLPKKLSATFNSALVAKELAKKELPDVRIEVMDAETAAAGETLLALFAARAVKEGKNFDEIIQMLENLKKRVKVLILLETIRHIYRSGRIPEVASKIGSLLSLKVLLTIRDGEIHFTEVFKNKERETEKILKQIRRDFDKNLPDIGIMHADCPQEAQNIKEKLKKLLPSARIFISGFSPVMGYATGRGTLVIGFFAK